LQNNYLLVMILDMLFIMIMQDFLWVWMTVNSLMTGNLLMISNMLNYIKVFIELFTVAQVKKVSHQAEYWMMKEVL
jgi:hypothetical protein